MSATNHTTNYNLPQFIGTDVPSWLSDVNGAMSAIDTAIKSAATDAAGAATLATNAKNKADAVELSLGTTNGNVSTLQGTVESQGTAIAANTSKIGSAALATVSQNLSGAVNELVARIPSETRACDQLAMFTETVGPKTLAYPITDYRYLVCMSFASGVVYDVYTIPVEVLFTIPDTTGWTYTFCTQIGNTERRIDLAINSATQATSSNRHVLNVVLFGVR